MRFIFNEDQILRLKKRLAKENINEYDLDDLIAKGGSVLDKAADSSKELIPGLETDVEKKVADEPKKADFIGDDVEEFYKTLELIDQPVVQQKYGSMTHQQSVEATQIALQILGYKLPRFGTDGLFGPETAAAVRKYKQDRNISDKIEEAFVAIGDQSYSHVKVDADTSQDEVNSALLDDLQAAGEAAGVVITITTASTGHSKYTKGGKLSRHGFGTAVDVALLNGVGYGNKKFKEYGDKVKDALVSMGYSWNSESGNPKAVLWQTNIGGNHYNHLHVSNQEGVSGAPSISAGSGGDETITPEMAKQLIDDLKEKGITSEDIKQYIDPAVTTGGSVEFTDLDLTTQEGVEAYEEICDNFIRQRNPGAFVTGAMMADAAEKAYKQYRKYIPPELALAQLALEGGISKDTSNRPIRTKNPFNVGNTPTKDNPRPTFEDGVNIYYDLIARRYLVKGKTANDLINDFKNDNGNAYADPGYEEKLKTLVKNIREKNAPIYAALNKKKSEALSEALLAEADKRQAIKNVFGFNDNWANQFHNLSDKISIWIADTFLKKAMEEIDVEEGDDPRRGVVRHLNSMEPDQSSIWRRYRTMYEYILHWFRAPRREQINIRQLSLDDAYALAQEWHDTLQARKQADYNETGDVFIDYRNADGVGYYWVNLQTNYCSEEAERMGHCARANTPGSKLISLRRINEFGEGESLLTVDYRPGGVLGDFHRHGNKKPTSRFHDKIVDFLINKTYPVSELSMKGVHRYEENFHLSDLSPENLRKVYQANPALRLNISDEANWPEIINAIITDEISMGDYSGEIRIKLLGKAISIGRGEEFAAKFDENIIVNTLGSLENVSKELQGKFLETFADLINKAAKNRLDEFESLDQAKSFFVDSLREFSQNYFDHYRTFCPFIDYGFRKFSERDRVDILGSRGIKRTLFACTDVVPFLARFIDNSPVDANGNIAVKTEEGLWGLVKQNGETILHPQFAGITPNRIDKTGKTYLVKNLQNQFFSFNPETGDYKRYAMKS